MIVPQRKSQLPVVCYYAGKAIGRCSVTDGKTYTSLMESFDGSPARILREQSHISSKLKAILVKAAKVEQKQERGYATVPGLLVTPKDSPWGKVNFCDTLCHGVYDVITSSHGGIMVARDVDEFLSPEARKHGKRNNGFLCFEESIDANIVYRELLDKKLWKLPDYMDDKSRYEKHINMTLINFHPRYWRSREKAQESYHKTKSEHDHYDR